MLAGINRGSGYAYTKDVQHDRNRKGQKRPENNGGPGYIAPIVKLSFNFIV
jgi:hypothetical protein